MKLIFKWFDFWIGIYIDTEKDLLYFLPIPMAGIVFKYTTPINWLFRRFGHALLLNFYGKHTKDGECCWGYRLNLLGKNFYRKQTYGNK